VFADVCEAAAGMVGEEEAATAVARVLARWLADGMVTSVDVAT
jgi:hypothetical protein